MPKTADCRQAKSRARTHCATAPQVKIIVFPGIRRACRKSAQSGQGSQHERDQCEGTRPRSLSARQTEPSGIRIDPGNQSKQMAPM
ncbi:unnamed protein product [Penicillium salamii]|uniref:Uncharacterized protein n=1 Tax=Penicillium salamii TaxID=1612424 RepID=A0A9W4NSR5_9EURO|nr:unnamed protein product [Penicillium salamii]CAG8274170.1 unnamed protein product [Penicillium salamii]CAG8375889.1 unnamed protein product [Penicillium salamii]CAG8381187.1 unnamed protein product [Penicillium salamii]CAG8412197.1 unnamed protein product [Penicillium salamii]